MLHVLQSNKEQNLSIYDLAQDILNIHKALAELEVMDIDIQGEMKHLEYLDIHVNHFFLMQDALSSHEAFAGFSSSTEAITAMSKSSQELMSKMTDYMKTFFQWSDQVLVVSLKNTQRIVTALTKALRADIEKKDKLIKNYKTRDLSLPDYQICLKSIIKMNDEVISSLEQLRNINGENALVECQSIRENLTNDTAKFMDAISEFINKRSNEEEKITPDEGKWFQDSYVQQLGGVIQDCISSLQKVKRLRSTITQILNGMKVTMNAKERKVNNEKLSVAKELFMDKIKTNLGHMSTLTIYLGKKTQTLLAEME